MGTYDEHCSFFVLQSQGEVAAEVWRNDLWLISTRGRCLRRPGRHDRCGPPGAEARSGLATRATAPYLDATSGAV